MTKPPKLTEPLASLLALVACRSLMPPEDLNAEAVALLTARGLVESVPDKGSHDRAAERVRVRATRAGLSEVLSWRETVGLSRAVAGRCLMGLLRAGAVSWPKPECGIGLKVETLPWRTQEAPDVWTLAWWRDRRVDMAARIERMDIEAASK